MGNYSTDQGEGFGPWVWCARSFFSLLDQGLTSGSTFVLNVMLARWLTPEKYGAFAVSFAGFLFVSGFHNVIFVEPMTVIGPSSYPGHLTAYFSAQLRGHLAVVCVASGIGVLAGGTLALISSGNPLATAVLAVGISTPFLLLLWLARRMCYVVQNPSLAAQASTSYFVLLLAGAFALWKLELLGPGTAFLWMSCVSAVVSFFVLRRLGVSVSARTSAGPSLRRVLRENWSYGRLLTLTNILSWMSLQAQTFFAAGMLGLSAAGVLRAMQLPALAMTQVIIATTLLVLPSMSAELGRGNIEGLRQKAILASLFLTVSSILFVSVLYLFSSRLEGLLFGARYSSGAWLIPVFGLVPVFSGLSSSLSLALRALRRSEFELLAYVLSTITALLSASMLIPRWGLSGAAISIVGSTAVLAAAVLGCFWKWGKAKPAKLRELQTEEAF